MWFGQEGRHGVCIVAFSCCDFQIMTTNAYIFMYAIHEQHSIMIMQIVIIIYARKKDNKKASSNILVQTSKANI